ncbi:UDP-galactose/UDP-glucose transporter 5B-like [Rutidosis leptorrhynchoides]|uniref:UDP-galactose/UDP-glucose transporter 5B-like n=1 Tax=Rutidosis leptorrhynchoides TaxID=125765 RepID=UPI003A992B34
MIPVMIWGTLIMQKKYKGLDYFLAVLVTLGCSLFILFPGASELSPYHKKEFDGFTSTFQDKLFKGYDMGIYNQIFYTTLCSCILSLTGLLLQGNLLLAIDFGSRHKDCFFDIALLSTVATASQFFISYTFFSFGALTFATILTTRQANSICQSSILISKLSTNLLFNKPFILNSAVSEHFFVACLVWSPS